MYAFTSFYLITSSSRESFISIVYYGFYGFLFALAYMLLNLFVKKFIPRHRREHKLVINIAIGILSGIFSACYSVFYTFYTAIEANPGIEATQTNRAIMLEMLYFLLGCIIIGAAVGYFDRED